jgi:hypothetical protein
MNREMLLTEYFGVDVSGNDIDGLKEHYVRVNPRLITKNKSIEFLHVMDTLIPDWKIEGMIQGRFTIEGVNYANDALCICTQCITDICYLKHPKLALSVQVGNVCVGKISPELQKEAESLVRRMKKAEKDEKKRREENRRCMDCNQYNIPNPEPEYKKRCLACYVAHKQTQEPVYKRLTYNIFTEN